MKPPEISVIMPAYNHESFVGDAIESVLSQTFADFEFIIINDGSTDKTEDVVRKYDDPRINYLSQENRGCAYTLNRAIGLSKGRYISIINSDDIYHKDRIAELIDIAKRNNLDFLITDIVLIDKDGNVIDNPNHWWIKWYQELKSHYLTTGNPLIALFAGNYTITTSNFFLKAESLKEIGMFRSYKFIIDYDFAYRCITYKPNGFRFLTDKKLLFYRLHGGNTILKNPLLSNHETFCLLKGMIKDLYGEEISIPLEHLHKVTRYMIKDLNIKRKNKVLTMKNEFHAKESELCAKEREIQDLSLYTSRLLNEFYLIRDSRSYKIGRGLTSPLCMLRDLISSKKNYKYVRLSVNNVQELKIVLNNIDKHFDVFSFDIFDTILERNIDPPDKVKEIVARNISPFLKENYGLDLSMFDLLQLRNKTELRLREEALSEGKDFECRYSNIVKEMVKHITGKNDESLFLEIIRQEIKTENEVLHLKDGIIDILRSLKDKGKKVIAISDMYLDKEYIQEILRLKSIDHFFDKVYVSSEQAICKYSGKLFKHVMAEEKVLPIQILHIGDNIVSDHKVPKRLMISTICLKDKEYQRKKYILKTYNKLATDNPYWRGRHLLQLIRPLLKKEDFFYGYGFSFLGPIYSTFIYGVIELIKRYKIKKVYFIAREGELFHRIFKIFESQFFKEDNPETRYVYLTRKSTALASAYKGLTHEKAIIPLYNPRQQGLYSVFTTFNLPLEELTDLAKRYGFKDIKEPIHDWHNKRFKSFLQDKRFQNIVIKYALTERKLLEDYLSQVGFFNSETVSFVDIGWNVTIQKFIQDAFIEMIDFPHIYGFYLGFRSGIKHELNKDKNTVVGVLYDERRGNPLERILCRFEELFEEGARALHPTVVGYKKNIESGLVEPVFKDEQSPDRKAELLHNEKIAELQSGIIDFSKEFLRAIYLTGYTFEDIKPFILSLIERGIAFPTLDETNHFLNISHSEDFGYENIMDFSNYRIKNFSTLLNPYNLFQMIKNSNWSYGSAKSSRIPGINFLLRLYDILWEPNL